MSAIFNSPTETITEPISIPVAEPEATGGFFAWVQNNFIKIVIIIVILAFLGFNLFTFLGNTTNVFVEVVKPVAQFFGFTVGETVKKTVDVSAKGTKLGVDVATGAIDDAINVTEEVLGADPLKTQLDSPTTPAKEKPQEPEADDATSKTQSAKTKTKAGFCYIGEDRGFRSCIKINEGDECMSGKVFKRMDICKNPNLRD